MGMSGYAELLIMVIFAVIVVVALLLIARFLGPYRMLPSKLTTYECGVEPFGDARGRFSVKFFMIGIAFLIFDIEVALLFPWAVKLMGFKHEGLGKIAFIEGAIFVIALLIGLIYILRRRILEWE
jgi:NADH-quinone oxidoreductase subunit A